MPLVLLVSSSVAGLAIWKNMGGSPQKWDVTALGCYRKVQAHCQCCARRVLEVEGDFQDQKGRLQEEVEALGRCVLFPKLSL